MNPYTAPPTSLPLTSETKTSKDPLGVGYTSKVPSTNPSESTKPTSTFSIPAKPQSVKFQDDIFTPDARSNDKRKNETTVVEPVISKFSLDSPLTAFPTKPSATGLD